MQVVNANPNQLNLTGRLVIKDQNGKIVPYGNNQGGLQIWLEHQGKQIAQGSFNSQGQYTIPAPRSIKSEYKAQIRMQDTRGHYLDNTIDVTAYDSSKDIFVGETLLVTKSGAGCQNAADSVLEDRCWAAQQSQMKQLRLLLQDRVLQGQQLQFPIAVEIKESHSDTGRTVYKKLINSDSVITELPAGNYLVLAQAKGYDQDRVPVSLHENMSVRVGLTKNSGSQYRIIMHMDNEQSKQDYDLNLKIRAKSGRECTVTPYSDCPYARHVQDVQLG